MKLLLRKVGIFVLVALCLLTLYLFKEYRTFSDIKSERIEKIKEKSTLMVTELGTIEYAIQGEGNPVLMIHGAGGGYDQGLLLADYLLPKDCKVIAISRFGYLGTPLPEDATPNHQAALYKALLDELGIDKVDVVGVSDGGPSALKFSIFYPEYTKSLTMISAKSKTPPPLTPVQAAVFGTIFDHDFLFWMITEHTKSQLTSVLGVSMEVQENMTPEEQDMVTEFLGSINPICLRKGGILNANVQFKTLSPEDYPLWKIQAPTLVIHAVDDTLQPFYYAEYTHEQIKGAKLLSFPTGGHMLFGHKDEIISEIDKLFKNQQ